ncbi:17-beta-hydroxysteroid dehydrogenase type 3-like [Topomyia yanbarensis]|uniref:17-beta-hydroxysteroid dehydrogenase type 3-like n=1 Tax=Topomyia yanbarensis TaxID=2498891 RepID=UPI00273BA944|nr:17-beta-hydroxysteroid dehydrogenase type 3-like [Topomyia yanbarensis]
MELACFVQSLTLTLTVIGIYALTVWIYETFKSPIGILWGLSKQCICDVNFTERYGQWAVISGGSDGIGRQYARFFARKGLNIVIIALPDEILKQTAEEIESTFHVQVKQISADFSKGFELSDYLKNELDDLDVGVLVNNVGVANTLPVYYETCALSLYQRMVNVNINAAVILSHIILQRMKQRRRGLLINIASVAGLRPLPLGLMYSATKAFMASFSNALREELADFGIECQTVTPYFVATSMTEELRVDRFLRIISSDVETYGKFLTMIVGKTAQTTGYWLHGLTLTAINLLPADLTIKVAFEAAKSWIKKKNLTD